MAVQRNLVTAPGASLVPDFSRANNLALGIAQQMKLEKQGRVEQEEIAQIQAILAKQKGEDLFANPQNQNRIFRLEQLKPGLGEATFNMITTAQELEQRQFADELAENNRFITNYVATKKELGLEAANKLLLDGIVDRKEKGQETSEFERLLAMNGDDQDIFANSLRNQFGTALQIPEIGKLTAFRPGDVVFRDGQEEFRVSEEAEPEGEQQFLTLQSGEQLPFGGEGQLTPKQARDVDLAERKFAIDFEKFEEGKITQQNIKDAAISATVIGSDRVMGQIDFLLGIKENEQGELVFDAEGEDLVTAGNLGRFGAIARFFGPGGESGQLQRVVQTIESNLGIKELLEIKKAGATFGQLSDRELSVLQTRIANLGLSARPEEFAQNLLLVRQSYANLLDALEKDGVDIASFRSGGQTPRTGEGNEIAGFLSGAN